MLFVKTSKQTLAIDLGSYSVKFAVGVSDNNSIVVNDVFSAKLPEGVYCDGVILNKEKLVEFIKDNLRDAGIKAKKTIVTFSSSELIQRELTCHAIDHENLLGVIKYEISQYLPINLDDYDISYKIISKFTEDGVDKYNLNAYIVNKNLITPLNELLKDCNLVSEALDIHSNAISKILALINRNTVSSKDSEEKKTRVFVDLGHKNMLVDIFEGEEVVLSRVINKGFINLDELISETLGMNKEEAEVFRKEKIANELGGLTSLYENIKYIDFQKEEIEKSEHGLGKGLMSSEEKLLFSLIRDSINYFNDIARELGKNLQFYLSRNKNNKVDEVLFHGEAASNNSLIEFFSQNTDFKTRKFELKNYPFIQFKCNVDSSVSFVNVLGALLRRKED